MHSNPFIDNIDQHKFSPYKTRRKKRIKPLDEQPNCENCQQNIYNTHFIAHFHGLIWKIHGLKYTRCPDPIRNEKKTASQSALKTIQLFGSFSCPLQRAFIYNLKMFLSLIITKCLTDLTRKQILQILSLFSQIKRNACLCRVKHTQFRHSVIFAFSNWFSVNYK